MTISSVLNESIVFFKDSKKINKLIVKLEKKLLKINKQNERDTIKHIIEKLKFVADSMEKLENLYSTSKNKRVLRTVYKNIHKENEEIFEYIKKENVKKILISLGIFGVFTTIIGLVIDDVNKFLIDNNVLITKGKGLFPHVGTSYTDQGIHKMVAKICKEQNVSFKLVSTLIDKESRWNVNAINRNDNGTYDFGLMQLNSSNKSFFEKAFWDKPEKFDFKNPEHNAYVGIKFFKSLLDFFHNDVKKAVSAYNAGPAKVLAGNIPGSTLNYRNEILKNFQS